MGNKFANACLHAVDFMLNLLIFATLVVFYWRGTWNLIDIYFLPGQTARNAWGSFGIGHGVMLTATLAQGYLKKIDSRKRLLFIVISRIYTYFVAFGSVSQWHGVWLVYDFYAGTSWLSAFSSFIIGSFFLIVFRSYSNVFAPPLVIGHDTNTRGYFTVTTRLGDKVGNFFHISLIRNFQCRWNAS